MSTWATRKQAIQNAGQGLGIFNPYLVAGAAPTAAAAGSGFFSCNLRPNSLGSTLPSTIVSLQTPPLTASQLLALSCSVNSSDSNVRSTWLCWFYRFGVLTLTGTGEGFAADAITWPVTRTYLGQATQPVTLIPVAMVTTALTAIAATFVIQNVTGPASGYTNQDGTAVTGAKVFTFPSATTAASSAYILRLEDGDRGVRSITNINVTTLATTGVCSIWGAELLCPMEMIRPSFAGMVDEMFGSFGPDELLPAPATSGTPTRFLGLLDVNASASATMAGVIAGAYNV